MKQFLSKLLKHTFLLLLVCTTARAQDVLSNFENFQSDGTINTMAIDEANDILYVGGNFSYIGQMARNGAALSTSGTLVSNYPEINGTVRAVIPDGSGGFYIGGDFSEVGGLARTRLAQINSSGQVTSWDPSCNGIVYDLALYGGNVYIAGSFSQINGYSRAAIASVDGTTGDLTTWAPQSDSPVIDLEVSGSTLYVGGSFLSIGGQTRSRIAAFDLTTGKITSWNPGTINQGIRAITVQNGNVYIGGFFTSVDGTARNYAASISASTGALTSWNPSANSTVYTLASTSSTIYVGGAFTSIGGSSRSRIASFNESDGALKTWNPGASSNVQSFYLDGNTLYVAGVFGLIAGESRPGSAAFSTVTGLLSQSYLPSGFAGYYGIAASGSNVFLAGYSSGIGGTPRENLAAIDLTTGLVTSWDPSADNYVNDIELSETTVYVGGAFDNVGGATRNIIAELDKTTGNATSWDPNMSGSQVQKILFNKTHVLVGGSFTLVDGVTRNYLAGINVSDGSATSWNPDANTQIYDIEFTGKGTVFVGGDFTTIAGVTRNRLAEISLSTGLATSWDPNVNNRVRNMDLDSDGNLYIVGTFTSVGSDTRNRIAAIDPSSGLATSWNPNANNTVNNINIVDDVIYAVGYFTSIAGTSKSRAAAINRDGTLTSWDITSNNLVNAVLNYDYNTILGGSSFTGSNGLVYYGTFFVDRANGPALAVTLDSYSVPENSPVNTLVATLSSQDDAGDTHTYSLVSGHGDTDNAQFTVVGDEVFTAAEFDFEDDAYKNIRVSSTDNNGNVKEQLFLISVTDVIETGNDILSFSFQEGNGLIDIDTVNHIVKIDAGDGVDRSSLTPDITVSSGATVSPLTGVAQNFSGNVTYTVTAEDGTTQDWTIDAMGSLPGGTYYVKSGGDFTTLKRFMDRVNADGIAGDIIAEISGDQDSNPSVAFVFYNHLGQDQYSITLKADDTASPFELTDPLRLYGTKNFHVDGGDKMTIPSVLLSRLTETDNSKNITISNSIISGAIAPYWADDVVIDGNTFTPVAATTSLHARRIYMDNGENSNITISNNLIYFDQTFNVSSSQSSTTAISASQDVGGYLRVFNNVIHLNPQSASNQYGVQVSYPTGDLEIYNNTIYIEGSNVDYGTYAVGIYVGNSGQPTNSLKIKNNLIHLNPLLKPVSYNLGIWYYNTAIPTVEIDANNITYTTLGSSSEGFMRVGSTHYNAANEETMYSLFGTTTTEPNFTDAANLDFTLTGSSLSEADLRGVPVPYATEDYNGTTRSTSAPSKGAFESPNNITDITGISFTGQSGDETIDKVNAEVTAQVPYGTDVSAVAVDVSVFAGADVSPASGSTQDFSSGGVTYTVTAENSDTRDWTINLVPQNDAPTDITLSNSTINENAGPFASVGNFSTTDLNVGQTHTYTLVAGTGDDDNATFSIAGANLRAFGSLNYEAKDTYTIRVQTDDGAGGLYEEAMTITVNNVWEAPSDISITNFQLADENNAINDELFTLSTTDPDNGETYTYTLVAGTGDDDNASFSISGDKILAQDFFNHEVKDSYTIRVETDDNNGFQFEKSFTILINDLNDDPTEVQISSSSILEGNSINDVVGTLSTVDEDDTDTHVYSLVSGTGSAGNASFNINGNELRASAVFDYETADSWVIRVRTDDQNGGIHDEVIFIDITNDPEAPTDISLSANTIAENNSVSDVIGNLTTTDPDNGETYTYTLVAGTGDDDNASFTISGDELQAGISFDHETKDTYSIRVRTDDGNSNQFEKSFAVTVSDINEAPTDIMLSSNEILEGNSVNDIIGSLSSTDDDADTHVYSLVSGAGDDDNASFNVSGSNLQASEVFDFETANSYSIRLRTDDQNGGIYEEVFSISITNDPEAPTDILLSANSILENNSVGDAIGTLSTTDPDNGETFTYSLVTGTGDDDNTSFSIVGDELRAAEQFDFETKSSYSVRIETNDGNGGTYEEAFSISISDEDPETVEWDGASWSNGSGPTSSDPVLFSGNYTGGFDGNDIEVLTGVTVTVTSGNTADIAGDVNNQGSIVVESGATLLTYETGIVSGNNITIQRNTRYSDGKYSFVGSPVEQNASVTGSDLGSFVYKYDESVSWGSNEGLDRWVSASADELVPGQGYTQAYQQLIEFSGVPNTGSVAYNGTYTGTYNDGTNESTEGWNLVANPYAAAINVSDFLTENTNNTGAVYFWDDNGSDIERGDNADYVVANGIAATNTTPAGGESRYNLHIGSAQGFFVQLASDIDTDVTFTEAMRVSGNNGDGAFFRTESVPLTRLNLTSNNGLFKQAVIGWVEEASSNIDRRFDAPIFDATLPASVYTVKNKQALAIQGASLSDEMVSVGVNIPENGVYSISVELEDHESTTILWDKLTDTKIDITHEAYEFSSQEGIFTDRFVILKESVITGSALSLSESVVYSYQNQVFIKNVEGLSVDYQIFSLKGDKVWSGKVEGSRELLLNVPEGIYMVTDGATSWKILLNNN